MVEKCRDTEMILDGCRRGIGNDDNVSAAAQIRDIGAQQQQSKDEGVGGNTWTMDVTDCMTEENIAATENEEPYNEFSNIARWQRMWQQKRMRH